jgi:hypothetical protein
MARWTTVDPSGFPDGANNRVYVNNRSPSFIDNNGLNIYQVTDTTGSAAGLFGHSAGIVGNNSTGYNFISYGGTTSSPSGPGQVTPSPITFSTISDAMKFANQNGYNSYNQWNTSASQDQAFMTAFINNANSSSYNLIDHNCQDAVNAGLDAAGVNYLDNNIPNIAYLADLLLSNIHGKTQSLE